MATKTLNSLRVKNQKIEYITDNKGRKTKVVLPIEDFENIMEDLYDLSVVRKRKSEKLVPYGKLLSSLKRDGKI